MGSVAGAAKDCTIQGTAADDSLKGGDGNDFLKSRDRVSGNDNINGSTGTDTCVIDAGDSVGQCEL